MKNRLVNRLRRVVAFVLATAMITTNVNPAIVMAEDGDGSGGGKAAEPTVTYTVNDQEVGEGGIEVEYGASIEVSISGLSEVDEISLFYKKEGDDLYKSLEGELKGLEPGLYYLGYNTDTNDKNLDFNEYFFKVVEVALPAPSGLSWEDDKTTANWSAVTQDKYGNEGDFVEKYQVKLYKNGINEAVKTVEVSGDKTSYDFWETISNLDDDSFGKGDYTFSVKAVPKNADYYLESAESGKCSTAIKVVQVNLDKEKGIESVYVPNDEDDKSIIKLLLVVGSDGHNSQRIEAEASDGWSFKKWSSVVEGVQFAAENDALTEVVIRNDYESESDITVTAIATESIAPSISKYEIGTDGNEGKLTATVIDDKSGLTGYLFSTKNRDDILEDDWEAISPATNDEQIYMYEPAESGKYYFYAKDSEENIGQSEAYIPVSKIILNGYYENNAKFNDKTIIYMGNSSLTLPSLEDVADATPNRKGYEFVGWYKDADFSGDAITNLTDNDGEDVTLFAKWEFSNPSWETYLSEMDETYKGDDFILKVKAAGNSADISYKWYRKNEQGDFEAVEENSGSYSVRKFSDSGVYRVDAIVSYVDDSGESKTFTLEGDETNITIKRAPLSINATAINIKYLDDEPGYGCTFTGLVGDDIVYTDGVIDNTKAAENVFSKKGVFSSDYKKGDGVKEDGYQISLESDKEFAADNYSLTVNSSILTVEPKPVDDTVLLTIDPNSYTYTGDEISVSFSVTDASIVGEDKTIPSANYSATYDDNVKAGEHILSLEFTGNYTGTKTSEFSIVKNEAYNPTVSIEGWTYDGEAKNNPTIDGVPFSDPICKYYYVLDNNSAINSVTDSNSWTETKPVNAGKYKIYASVTDPDGNYATKDTEVSSFEIKRKVIVIESGSQTWDYDGWAHIDHSYKLLDKENHVIEDEHDAFVLPSESFQYITINGSITNVVKNKETGEIGGVDNGIVYKLSSATNLDNYDIQTLPGTLKLNPIKITSPAGVAWDSSAPGTATWVAIVKDKLNVQYEVELFEHIEGQEDKLLKKETVSGTSYNFRNVIHESITEGSEKSFYFKVKTIPVGGDALDDYLQSDYSESSNSLYTVTIGLSKNEPGSGLPQPGLKTINFASDEYKDKEFVTLVSGESIEITAESNPGYDFYLEAYATVDTSSNNFFSYKNTHEENKCSTVVTVKDNLTGSLSSVLITAKTLDITPHVSNFNAENLPESNYNGVKVTFDAHDSIGIRAYGVMKGEIKSKKDEKTGETISVFEKERQVKSVNVTPDGAGNYANSVHAEFVISEPGIYVATSSDRVDEDGNPIMYWNYGNANFTVYEIKFDKGTSADTVHTMPNIYKLANSEITLPQCTYVKEGSTFKNWMGENTGSTVDQAIYKANQSDELTAQWSSDEYKYKVEYYYMNSEGGYNNEPDDSSYFAGNYNDEITVEKQTIQKGRQNYSLDTAPSVTDYKSQITITGDNQVLKVYYKTFQYRITYKYTKPGEEETIVYDDYYFGKTIVERPKPTAEGYDFIGWNYEGAGSVPETMPAQNLIATGTFVPKNAQYKVVYHLETVGVGENKTNLYAIDAERTQILNAKQDDVIKAYVTKTGDVASNELVADEIDGFTIKGIKISKGTAIDANSETGSIPEDIIAGTDVASGVVKEKESEQLIINLYYTRNVYNLAIDVWATNRENPENRVYHKTYKHQFDEGINLEPYKLDETYLNASFPSDDNGIKFELPVGYEFAKYTDYSTGVMPETMPAGAVTVTRDIISNSKVKYDVNIFFESTTIGEYDKQTTLEMEADEGAIVRLVESVPVGETSGVSYVNYKDVAQVVPHHDYYTYVRYTYGYDDEAQVDPGAGDTADIKATKNKRLVVNIYYERMESKAKIIYYYRQNGGSDKIIAEFVISGKWGTTYEIDPAALFKANTSESWLNDAIKYDSKPETIDLIINPSSINVEGKDTNALQYNFIDDNYLASYNTYYRYFNDDGILDRKWLDQTMKTWGTSDVHEAGNKTSGLNNKIRCSFGVPYSKTEDGDSYFYIHYNQIDDKDDFYLEFQIDTSERKADSTIGLNKPLYKNESNELVNYNSPFIKYVYEHDGETEELPLRVINARAIINDSGRTTPTGSTDVDGYPAASATARNYKYVPVADISANPSTYLNNGFHYIDGEYYYYDGTGSLTDSTPCIYIADYQDRFIPGAYTYYSHTTVNNVTTPDYQQVLDFLNKYKNEHSNAYEEDLYDENYASLYVYDTTWGSTYVTGNSSVHKYNFYYKDKCSIKYCFEGSNFCNHNDHSYVYNTTVSKNNVETACTHLAPKKDGYDVVWYLDSQYTKKIPDNGLLMDKDRTVYGHYEKSTIKNKEYVYYELADPITIDGNTHNYITEDIIDAVKNNSEYKDKLVQEGTEGAIVYKFDGAVVLTETVRQTYSYEELYLSKDAENKSYEAAYGKEGFFYDVTNTNNRSYGYVNTSPIKLKVYFARDKYTVKINTNVSDNANPEYKTLSVDQHVILTEPVREGYNFVGWSFVTENNAPYEREPLPDEEYIRMPAFNLEATAIWEAGEFENTINHYFQSSNKTYNTSFYVEGGVTKSESATFNGKTGMAHYYGDDETISAVKFVVFENDKEVETYYFNGVISENNLVKAVTRSKLTSEDKITANEGAFEGLSLYEYSYTSYKSGTKSEICKEDEKYTAEYGMDVSYYYVRSADCAVNVRTMLINGAETDGATITGTGQYSYGETPTIEAHLASGYTFVGWYTPDDILVEYPNPSISNLADYTVVDNLENLITGEAASVTSIEKAKEFTIPELTSARDYVAIIKMNDVVPPTLAIRDVKKEKGGYVYGYEESADNVLMAVAKVEADGDTEASKTRIKGYQWYMYTGDKSDADITDSDWKILEGETNAIHLFEQGKNAGEYKYKCVVEYERTDTKLSGKIEQMVTVKVDKANFKVTTTNFEGVFDNTEKSIRLVVEKPSTPGGYQIYYHATNELTADNYNNIETKSTIPTYTHVNNDGTNACPHTTYFYIHDESGNYNDYSGNATVNIIPRSIKIQTLPNVFEKMYDGSNTVSGDVHEVDKESDLIKFSRGRGTYYELTGFVDSDTDQSAYVVGCEAEYNDCHVTTAKNFTVSGLYLVNRNDGKNAFDYSFPPATSLVFSGNIKPRPIEIEWYDDDDIVFNGDKQAPKVRIKADQTYPIPSVDSAYVEVNAAGGQTNVGEYTATAQASINSGGKGYPSDYTFDQITKEYKIKKRSIVIKPQNTTSGVTYNGNKRTIDEIEIYNSTGSYIDENIDSVISNTDKFKVTATPQKYYANANTYNDMVFDNAKITTIKGVDLTENFDIEYAPGTLVIEKATVKVTGITVDEKGYDGTKAVVIHAEDAQLTFDPLYSQNGVMDKLSLDVSKIKAEYESAATNTKNVKIEFLDGALTGESAGNYILDKDNSQKTAVGLIKSSDITVKAKPLTIVYGQGASFESEYSGVIKGDGTTGSINDIEVTGLDTISYKIRPLNSEDETSWTNYVAGVTLVGDYEIKVVTGDLSTDNFTFKWVEDKNYSILKVTQRPVVVKEATSPVITKEYDGNKSVEKAQITKDEDYVFVGVSDDANSGVLESHKDSLDLNRSDEDGFSAEYDYKNVSGTGNENQATAVALINLSLNNDNYKLVKADGTDLSNSDVLNITASITKKKLNLTVEEKTIIYGTETPASYVVCPSENYVAGDSEYVINYDGFIDGESKDNLSGSYTISSTYDSKDYTKRNVGKYDVTVIIKDNSFAKDNYEICVGDTSISEDGAVFSGEGRGLIVQKAELTLTINDKEMTYKVGNGDGTLPTIKDYSYSGFKYGDSALESETGNGISSDEIVALGNMEVHLVDSKGAPFEEPKYDLIPGEYKICLANDPVTLENYQLKIVEGKLTVSKAGLYIKKNELRNIISNITKTYDGTTKADNSSIISNVDRGKLLEELHDGTGKGSHEHLMDVDYDYLKEGDGKDEPILIFDNDKNINAYPDPNVGDNKELTLSYKLNSYLAERYDLLTEKTDFTAIGEITKASLTITADNKEVFYGNNAPVYTYEATGLVNGETIEGTGDFDPKKVSFTCEYSNEPSSCTQVGDCTIAPNGPTSNNYNITFTNGTLTVKPAKLAVPTPVWDTTHPGTVSFSPVNKIGDVDVKGYIVNLYKDGGAEPVAKSGTIETPLNGNSVDFASDIRAYGGGKYTVKVQAVADTTNNTDYKNVKHSDLSAATADLYATKVTPVFTGAIEGEYTGVGTKVTIDGVDGNPVWLVADSTEKRGYVIIEGEEAYPVGATLRITTGYAVEVTGDSGLTVANQNVDGVNVSAYVSVASGAKPESETKVEVKLTKKPAKGTAIIVANPDKGTYGYSAGAGPMVTVTPNLAPDDDIKNIEDYSYKYSWKIIYIKGDNPIVDEVTEVDGTDTYKLLNKKNGTDEDTPVGNYRVYCTITATRNDNGESIKIENNTDVSVKRGSFSPKITISGWVYGQSRVAPVITDDRGTSNSGNTTYFYSDNSENWPSTPNEMFTDVGEYYVYAHINQTDNYDAVDTPHNTETAPGDPAKYVISKATLSTPANVTHKASSTAPYGKLSWDAVAGPSENAGNAGSKETISVKYRVKLSYVPAGDSDEVPISLTNDNTYDETVATEYDFTPFIKEAGKYKMTVQALVDEKHGGRDRENCNDSEIVVKDAVITIGANISSNGAENATGFEKEYDGSPLTLTADYSDGTENVFTYKWMKNGSEYTGGDAHTNEISITYVEENASFVCEITSGESTIYSKAVTASITPRPIIVQTDSGSKVYDGTEYKNTANVQYKLKDNITQPGLASYDDITDVAVIEVTGSITHVSENTTDKAKNTFKNLVITRGSKEVYREGAAANNYEIIPSYGTLQINPKPVDLGWHTSAEGTWSEFKATYSGKEKSVTATVDNKVSVDNVTDTVNVTSYEANKATVVGKHIARATALDNSDYTLTDGNNLSKNWEIVPKVQNATVTAEITNSDSKVDSVDCFEWKGTTFDNANNITPIVQVKDTDLDEGSQVLEYGTDYELDTDTSAKAVSKDGENYTVKVRLKGNYSGEIDLPWRILDVKHPQGTVKFSLFDTIWNALLETITFGRYTNNNITVIVTAKDEHLGSGLKSIKYTELNTDERAAYTQLELTGLEDDTWTSLEGVSAEAPFSGTFEVTAPSNNKKSVVVYVRIEDNAGHVTYISTDGLIMETIVPVISDIENDKAYCISKEFTVTDDNLDKVLVYRYENGTAVIDNTYPATTSELKLTLSAYNSKNTFYKIEAIDKAGNKTVIDKVTINKNHTWSYIGNGTDKLKAECTVDTCDLYNAIENNLDISVSISAADGNYKALAYTAETSKSELFDKINTDFGTDVNVGSVGTITYHKVNSVDGTTDGTVVSSATDAGEYYAEAIVTGADGQSYRIAKHFSIAKVPLKDMSLSAYTYSYNGQNITPDITVKATVYGSTITCNAASDYDVKLYKVTTNEASEEIKTEVPFAKNVGTYRYEATGKGNFSGTVYQSFTISKETPEIEVNVSDKQYDDAMAAVPTWAAKLNGVQIGNPEGDFSYEVYKDAGCTEKVASSDPADVSMPKRVGTYYVKGWVKNAENFSDFETTEPLSFAITSRPITITAASATDTYVKDFVLQKDAYEISSGSLAGNDRISSITITGSQAVYGSSENVADSAVIKDSDDDSADDITDCYDITYANGTLTLNKGIDIITDMQDLSKVYDGGNVADTVSFNHIDDNNGTPKYTFYTKENGSYVKTSASSGASVVGGAPKNAGTYYVQVVIEGDSNYSTTKSEYKLFTISKREVTIATGSDTWTYDGNEHKKQEKSATNLVDGDSVTNITYTGAITNAGTVNNTFTGVVIKNSLSEDVTKNYTVKPLYGKLKVEPRLLETEDLLLEGENPLTYNGTDIGPSVSVLVDLDNNSSRETTLVESNDFVITNKPSEKKVTKATAVGIYTVEVTGKGNYTGTISKTYEIIDKGMPEISGEWVVRGQSHPIVNNGKYCGGVTVTISDDNLKYVKITATGGEVTDTVDEMVNVSTKSYKLNGSVDGTTYTIEATDISENKTTWTILVWSKHSFTNYVVDTNKSESGLVYRAECDHIVCGAKDYIIKPSGEIDWQYEYTYFANDGIHSGTKNASERETYAVAELLLDGKVCATKLLDCEAECGRTAENPASSAIKKYVFDSYDAMDSSKPSGTSYIPYEDDEGHTHTYEIKVSPVLLREDGTYEKISTYKVKHEQIGIIPGDRAQITYDPNLFEVPWKVTLKNLPKDDKGKTIYPSALYVKIMYAEVGDAKDEDYRIITQQAGDFTNSVKCTAVPEGNGDYSYSGKYSVWQHIGGTKNSYYHRIQVVGYELNGVSYDVTSKQIKSECDEDHINHTVCYVDETESASGTILHELSNLLPALTFDMNDGTGNIFGVLWKGINALGEGGTVSAADIVKVGTPIREGYNFEGWYTKPDAGELVTGPVSLKNGCVVVYAKWSETIVSSNSEEKIYPAEHNLPTVVWENIEPKRPQNSMLITESIELPGMTSKRESASVGEDKNTIEVAGNKKDEIGNTSSENSGIVKEPETDIDKLIGNIKVYVATNDTELGKINADVKDKQKVIKTVMNAEIEKYIRAGRSIEVRVTVDPCDDTKIPDTDKKLIQNRMNKLKSSNKDIVFGRYIDLKLDWRVFGGEWNNVPYTEDEIVVTIEIPSDLQGDDRVFYLVHANESFERLLVDLDEDYGTITIATSDFKGTYAILYELKNVEDCIWHWFILLCAIATLLILILIKVNREENDYDSLENKPNSHEEEEKKRYRNSVIRALTFTLGTVLSVIFAIMGTCKYDWPLFIIQVLVTGLVEIYKEVKFNQSKNERK